MPDAAAARILQGVERREPRILIGRDARGIAVLSDFGRDIWKTLARRVQSRRVRVGSTRELPRLAPRVRRGTEKKERD